MLFQLGADPATRRRSKIYGIFKAYLKACPGMDNLLPSGKSMAEWAGERSGIGR